MSDSVTKLPTADESIEALLAFWFPADSADVQALQLQNQRWFMSSAVQDRELEHRFGDLARWAAAGKLNTWADSARGRLALIILLDQLPRNLHRGTPAAFAEDSKALELCRTGLENGHALALAPLERVFFCMPLQHAESPTVQELSVATFDELARASVPEPLRAVLRGFANYAALHRDIVRRFGRFPHRNKTMGRNSTDEEIDFLESGGPSFGQ